MSATTQRDQGLRPGRNRARSWSVAAFAAGLTAIAVLSVLWNLDQLKFVAAGRHAGDAHPYLEITERPAGLLPVPCPPDNPSTPAKIALGRRLFFDPLLSRDRTIACATCHNPAQGFSISEPLATGVGGKQGRRHPPTLINVAYNSMQFWDGRVGTLGKFDSLERQVLEPIRDPLEMDIDPLDVARRLHESDDYRRLFREAFGGDPTPDLIAKAIASFERTLLSGDAPYDRYNAGDLTAMSPAAVRGKELFFWKATCSACHRGPNFTDNAFHPGIASKFDEGADIGRLAATSEEYDRGSFKTPTLRDVARRGPYMHDGSLATLEEVVERYNRGGFDTHYWSGDTHAKIEQLIAIDDGETFRQKASPQLRAGFPLQLTAEEQSDLLEFLREGLSGTNPAVSPAVTKP
jgi:cytochrome c peroxidase